jgi:hypothetical protein
VLPHGKGTNGNPMQQERLSESFGTDSAGHPARFKIQQMELWLFRRMSVSFLHLRGVIFQANYLRGEMSEIVCPPDR